MYLYLSANCIILELHIKQSATFRYISVLNYVRAEWTNNDAELSWAQRIGRSITSRFSLNFSTRTAYTVIQIHVCMYVHIHTCTHCWLLRNDRAPFGRPPNSRVCNNYWRSETFCWSPCSYYQNCNVNLLLFCSSFILFHIQIKHFSRSNMIFALR